jgi:type IV secretion system protein TrbB
MQLHYPRFISLSVRSGFQLPDLGLYDIVGASVIDRFLGKFMAQHYHNYNNNYGQPITSNNDGGGHSGYGGCIGEGNRRLYEKLYRDLGGEVIAGLESQEVNEIILNPDGKLWFDHVSRGLLCVGAMIKTQAFSLLNSVAGIHSFVVSQHCPRLEAELPHFQAMHGERFTGQVPPIVSAPCFTIRKKSSVVFTLQDYIGAQRMSVRQAEILRGLVLERKNVLVCGGPGSGKTTITNALIAEAVQHEANQRFLLLEDLPELQCAATNKVAMLTSAEVDMTGLLRAAMRMRPDRILIGEVRGKEALDMLKAWNTGCPGGICTVHANGTEEAIQRVLDLAMEAGLTVPPIALLLHTVDAVVAVVRRGSQKGFISSIAKLKEYRNDKFIFEKLD